ncbi:MAG: transporter related protein [Conexibacter sp.]|nr:transporter related protein [Conexibacter sp.]MDX6717326.1 branched-chain amino acid transport system ATP-binding protein [Baekduia sp.]
MSTANGERLEAKDVRVHFDGVKAIDEVDLVVNRGELFGLIGPNGAGKTTLVNVLSGFQQPTSGRIFLSGNDVTKLPPHKRSARGLVRTFQGVRLFHRLTVFENVEVGALGAGAGRQEARSLARDLLERVQLADKADDLATSLAHGQERRLGIARALAMRPRFLLLDEPAAGLNEAESDELLRSLVGFRDEFSLGVLIIEHDMRMIMRLCERIQVLDHGKTIAIGTPAEVRANQAVIEAYLGVGRESDVAQG